jgi:hypothetical protein
MTVSAVKDVRSTFRAKEQVSRGGLLVVEIDAVTSSGPPSGSPHRITLRAAIDDLVASHRSGISVNDPYYGSQLVPYRYRVDYAEHREVVPKFSSLGPVVGQQHEEARFTVKVEIFVLSGVRVQRFIEETGKAARDFAAEYRVGALTIIFNVFAFQDLRRLPVPGQPLSQNLLYPFYEVFDDTAPLTRKQALTYLTVRHIPNGIEFTWIVTEQTLRVTLNTPGDGVSGFAYAVKPLPEFPHTGNRDFLLFDDLLHLRTCGDVKLTLLRMKAARRRREVRSRAGVIAPSEMVFPDPLEWERRNYPTSAASAVDPSLYRPIVESRFFRLQRVKQLNDLPAPGEIFTVRPDDDIAGTQYESFAPPNLDLIPWAQLVFDLGVGTIPIVGDIMDFADFNLALRTGKDKWGNEVDNVDLVLMGLAIIPLFGTLFQAFRKGTRTAKVVSAIPP